MRTSLATSIAVLIATLPAAADAPRPVPRDCRSVDPIIGGDSITALTCDGRDGFFVPSDMMRRPGGMAEAHRLHRNLLSQIDTLEVRVRALGTSTVALAFSRDEATGRAAACKQDRAACWEQRDVIEGKLLTCTLDASSNTLWSALGGGLVTGALCVGVAHSLPRSSPSCP